MTFTLVSPPAPTYPIETSPTVVAATVGIAIYYTDPDAILERYAQLVEIQAQKQQARPSRKERVA